MLALLPLHLGVLASVTDDGGLFEVEAARSLAPPGEVARMFEALVRAGLDGGTLVEEDRALIEGVRVLAETLDTARRIGGMKGGYLAVQALPPFQRGLHALRLPVELTAATPPAPTPEGQTGTPSWVRDAFGSAE